MTDELELSLYIFILAGFLGYRIITRAPPLLHPPLMSATNALSGISLIGSLVVAGAGYGWFSTLLGFIAVCCSATNVVGGFLITDRMLKMFKARGDAASRVWMEWVLLAVGVGGALLVGAIGLALGKDHSANVLRFLYIVSAVLFILGLQGLTSPRWARHGMLLAAVGMLVAIVGTMFPDHIV